MSWSKVLDTIYGQITNSGLDNNQIIKITLTPQNVYENLKKRYAFCVVTTGNAENIKDEIERCIGEDDFRVSFDTFENILVAKNSHLNNSNFEIENNWRGRLFYSQTFLDQDSSQTKKDFLLKSYWRVIVEKINGNFFTKFDIYPYFWHPGFSIKGKESFETDVKSYFERISKKREVFFDSKYDVVKVFARIDNLDYQKISFTDNESDHQIFEMSVSELLENTETENVIINKLSEFFG